MIGILGSGSNSPPQSWIPGIPLDSLGFLWIPLDSREFLGISGIPEALF